MNNVLRAIDRLAAYEDTGLSPEEIRADTPDICKIEQELASYKEAEENGLLIRLPQKVVYEIMWGVGKDCDHVCPASIDGVGCCSLCDNGDLVICEVECRQHHLEQLGKTAFLSREEAEAALKKQRSYYFGEEKEG